MQNKVKLSRGFNFAIILGFLLILGIVYFTMSKYPSAVSNLITISFIYVLWIFIKKSSTGQIRGSYKRLIYLSAFLVLFNVTISGLWDFNYYKKAIMYLTTIIWIFCCLNTKISKKTVYVILLINVIINCLYLIFFQQGFTLFEGEALLTLNFSNPNQTGMFILNSLLYLCVPIAAGLDLGLKKKFYIFLLCLLVPLFVSVSNLLFLTGCRSSFLSLFLFAALVVLDYLSKSKFRMKKWMCITLAVFPFVFVFLYLAFVGDLNVDASFGMDNIGKSNTTRIKIWKPIIDNISHYVVFGDYYGISGGTGMSQLHNTHLDVFASYGVIPLILFIIIIYKAMWSSMWNATCRFQRVSLYAFVSCLVSGTFEASLVAGSAGLFLLTVGFLLLANYQKDENIASQLCVS